MATKNSSRSATKYAILGVLTFGNMSGYDIRNIISGSIAYFWSESFGQIYPTLRKLAADHLIKPVKSEASGDRERQLYAITDKGRRELRAWLTEMPHPQPPRSEMLFKLFFGREIPVPASREHINVVRERQLKQLEEFDRVEASLRKHRSSEPGFPYWMLTLDYGREQAQGILRWCDRALHTLQDIENNPSSSEQSSNCK
jgi:PadR family transcriptional regulator, regulatory protein AphA